MRRPPICCARPGATARVAKALVGGALVAALLAVAEARSAEVGALLHSFHLRTFEALGRPRASGPFQYPNIAAMYLEAVAPDRGRARRGGVRGPTVPPAALRRHAGAVPPARRCLGHRVARGAGRRPRGGRRARRFLGRRGETRALAPALLATVLRWRRSPRARRWRAVSFLAGRRLVPRGHHAVGWAAGAAAAGARPREQGDRDPGGREPGGSPLAARPALSRGAVVPLARCRNGRHGGA